MISHRLVQSDPFGSVALRYQPRRRAEWGTPARCRRYLGVGAPPPAVEAQAAGCRRDRRTALVEAALFLAGAPLSGRRLCQLAGLADATEARTLVRRLNDSYSRQQCAFHVAEVAGGYQLLTHPRFSGWLRRLHPTGAGIRLSAPAMETLAVVAYRQPALRAEVESIRGVQCGEMLRQLMDRDLVRIVGRSHELGRPFLYGTTRRFLQVFGLASLDVLPRANALRRGAPGEQPPQLEVISGDSRSLELLEPPRFPKEESHVTISVDNELEFEELALPLIEAAAQDPRAHAKKKDEDDEEEEQEDEDDDDEDEGVDEEELEDDEEFDEDDDEWEEVDDDDEDWDDDDEEDDDDWDDDEDEDDEDWEEEGE